LVASLAAKFYQSIPFALARDALRAIALNMNRIRSMRIDVFDDMQYLLTNSW